MRVQLAALQASLAALVWLVLCAITFGQDSQTSSASPLLAKMASRTLKADSSRKLRSEWPHHWTVDRFRIYSTVPEESMHRATDQLRTLGEEIQEVLGIDVGEEEIFLVVMRDQSEYDTYLQKNFPTFPKRRALFVQHRGPGLVLTYQHSNWIVDARHECTHAILHQSGFQLPVWLDEGLAEYFETPGTDRTNHPEHRHAVASQLRYGQVITLEDLEHDFTSETLDAKGYRDAWSVVTLLLHHNDSTRTAIRQYVGDLQTRSASGYLSRRLSPDTKKNWRDTFQSFYREPSK